MNALTLPFSIAFGLIFGSFLSMLSPRLHNGEKGIVKGRSHCADCKHVLGAAELIPLFSYLFQRGRCRHCKKSISAWYPASELTVLLLSVGLAFLLPDFKEWLFAFPLIFVLAFIFIYDLRYQEIHEAVLFPGIAYALVWGCFTYGWQSTLLAMGIGGVFFGAQFLLSKGRWLGSGDIEIGLFMGALLGWPNILIGLFSSYLLGSLIGVGLLLSQKAKGNTSVPLGPFLVVGSMLSFVWGEKLLSLYFSAL